MDPAEAIVASAASASHYEPMLDVSAAPLNVPSTRLQAAIADQRFPFAISNEFFSVTPWDDMLSFLREASIGIPFEANGRNRRHSLLGENDEAMIVAEFSYGHEWDITVAATSEPLARKWMEAIATLLPEPPPPPPIQRPWNVIPVSFWMQNPMSGGASQRRRDITVHSWEEVQANYPASTRSELSALTTMDGPTGGKLLLFHGAPGLGKTRMILTLLSEWREWCSASVVTDADRFFGDPTYMNDLIFNVEGINRWLLLVIEDGDEYLNVNGRESKGQSIARLLNLADGIVGQGLNLLTLISTNVDVAELNPAVIRSGRCMANVQFKAFSPEDATSWLAEHGVEAEAEGEMTLADLYARLSATTEA